MNHFKLPEKKIPSLVSECQFKFSRSSGPGGQKVNKTETRVELLWPYLESALFKDEQKSRIADKLKNRINKNQELLVFSDRYRTRPQNRDHCIRKLVFCIEKALTQPKKRKKTKPTRASVERRIKDKKAKSDKKKMRQKL